MPEFREKLAVGIIASISASPMKDEMGIQGKAHAFSVLNGLDHPLGLGNRNVFCAAFTIRATRIIAVLPRVAGLGGSSAITYEGTAEARITRKVSILTSILFLDCSANVEVSSSVIPGPAAKTFWKLLARIAEDEAVKRSQVHCSHGALIERLDQGGHAIAGARELVDGLAPASGPSSPASMTASPSPSLSLILRFANGTLMSASFRHRLPVGAPSFSTHLPH